MLARHHGLGKCTLVLMRRSCAWSHGIKACPVAMVIHHTAWTSSLGQALHRAPECYTSHVPQIMLVLTPCTCTFHLEVHARLAIPRYSRKLHRLFSNSGLPKEQLDHTCTRP